MSAVIVGLLQLTIRVEDLGVDVYAGIAVN